MAIIVKEIIKILQNLIAITQNILILSKLKKNASVDRKTKLLDEDKVDNKSAIIDFFDYFQESRHSEVVKNWSGAGYY